MNQEPVIIRPDLGFKELLELVVSRPNTQFFVVDHENKFVGSVALSDVRRVLLDQDYLTDLLIALDLVNSDIPSINSNDNLDTVMKILGNYDIEELPVVDEDNGHIIVGSVNRKDVIETYNRELVKRNISQEISGSVKLLEKIQTVDFIDDYSMAEVSVPGSFVGRSILDINIRAKFGIQVLMIKRKSEDGGFRQIVPSPNEIFRNTDHLVIMGKNKDIEIFKHLN
jgi:CBS domain-containing protein